MDTGTKSNSAFDVLLCDHSFFYHQLNIFVKNEIYTLQGFVCSALFGNIYRYFKTDKGDWSAEKVIDIPAKTVEGWALPEMPSVLTDIVVRFI